MSSSRSVSEGQFDAVFLCDAGPPTQQGTHQGIAITNFNYVQIASLYEAFFVFISVLCLGVFSKDEAITWRQWKVPYEINRLQTTSLSESRLNTMPTDKCPQTSSLTQTPLKSMDALSSIRHKWSKFQFAVIIAGK